MRTETRENLIIVLLLLVAVLICYSAVLNAGFVWDDEYIILRNPLIRAPLYSFQIFKQDIVNSNFTYTIYYRPLQILSYALDYRLGGMDPFVFHFSSVLLHFMNGILVFLLAERITREKAVAFLVALFFTVHPAQVAAVSYISSRTDLLFFFFGSLCMIFFILFREKKDPLFLAASVASMVLSLLSKEAAVIFPLLILFMDATVLKGEEKIKITRHLPYFLTAGIYLGLHRLALGARYSSVFRPEELAHNFQQYLRMAGDFFAAGIIPLGLQVRKGAAETGAPLLVLALAGLLVVLAFLFLKRDRKTILFSLGFFMIALLPLVFVIGRFEVLAEHWMYLASFGIFLFLAIAIKGLCEKAEAPGRITFIIIIFFGVFFYSGKTIGENIYWRTDVDLSDRVLASSAKDAAAMHFKAVAHLKDGKKAQTLYIMKEYVKGHERDPRAWYLKGRLTLAAGEVDEAERDFRKAVSLNPDYCNGYLGLALVALVKERKDEGIRLLERAIEINPGYSEAFLLLVTVYAQAGDTEKTLETAKKAKEINPYDLDVLINLGTAYTRKGDLRNGALLYLEASRLYPESSVAQYNLGYIFYVSGQKKEAKTWLRRAVMVDPEFEPAIELLRKMR
ncbi:MAG: tetratricopeptide repeat protein [Candidatus Omnitrophota bacterium]